ncbi:hypothetical protein FYJ24_03050 [Actinomycetaceae bacterium WB03_NA08]|uniref:Uncharacterized protein n=1 Tax=Scrofimicrobium canadense TaxID=2652290 RepID=A0A6N7W5N7_9ACTO|nr:hypothetical protein [Scrofimicrobium canadense]
MGQGEKRRIDSSTTFGLFGTGEPTWGEINYRAFGVCSNDFHNELYGHMQRYLEAQKGDGRFANEREIDDFLVEECWWIWHGVSFDFRKPDHRETCQLHCLDHKNTAQAVKHFPSFVGHSSEPRDSLCTSNNPNVRAAAFSSWLIQEHVPGARTTRNPRDRQNNLRRRGR